MRVDLGCGSNRHPDCFGIDIIPSSDVDLVCDYESGLPLPDDSVRFLTACRSLEYASDLLSVMLEIYRVCAHGAIVCITAPYAQNGYHMANPSYKTRFNEYTPCYLSPDADLKEQLGETEFPAGYVPAQHAGLDFRLIRMELFYAPQYTSPFYEDDERRAMVHHQWNVADEIMYHFVVVKKPITQAELDALAQGSLEEPLRMAARREQDMVRRAEPVEQPVEEAQHTAEQTAVKRKPNRSRRNASTRRSVRTARKRQRPPRRKSRT